MIDEKIKELLILKRNGEFDLISENIPNMTTRCIFHHNKCGNTFIMTPHNLINNKNNCTVCGKNTFMTYEELKEKVYNMTNGEYELISSFDEIKSNTSHESLRRINRNLWGTFIHHKCGNTFSIRISNFLKQNNRCTHCKPNKKYTNETFQEKLDEIHGKNILQLVSEYKNKRTKVTVKCLRCNNLIIDTPGNFITNKRTCTYCHMSKNEERIMVYLKNHNINYNYNYPFDDCKYKALLRFDFWLPDYNFIIEFDGPQHFEPVTKYLNSYEETRIRDNIKNKYCLNKKIGLMRIPYTESKLITNLLDCLFDESNENSTTIENCEDIFYSIDGEIQLNKGLYSEQVDYSQVVGNEEYS